MKNTRIITSIGAILLGFLTIWYAMYKDQNVVSVATGITMMLAPLYGYLYSKTKENIEKIKKGGNEDVKGNI